MVHDVPASEKLKNFDGLPFNLSSAEVRALRSAFRSIPLREIQQSRDLSKVYNLCNQTLRHHNHHMREIAAAVLRHITR